MKKKTKKSIFKIQHFEDYHEIRDYAKNYKSMELGCFPVEDHGYCRYFGLFYKGKLPSLERIIKSIKKKINFSPINHYATGEDISINLPTVIEEIKQSLKYHEK